MKKFFAKVWAGIKLVFTKVVLDNVTDSNGDVDVVRVSSIAVIIICLNKLNQGTIDPMILVAMLGALGSGVMAKATDPKKQSLTDKILDKAQSILPEHVETTDDPQVR